MNNNELMSKIFGFSSPTYFRWKKEKRPIISLLEEYFTKDDLIEFLNDGYVYSYEKKEASARLFRRLEDKLHSNKKDTDTLFYLIHNMLTDFSRKFLRDHKINHEDITLNLIEFIISNEVEESFFEEYPDDIINASTYKPYLIKSISAMTNSELTFILEYEYFFKDINSSIINS